MKNKSRISIILIALLVIVISLSVGFGTWIISNYVNSKPNDGVNKVITRYLDSKTAVYDGNVLLPSSKEIGTVGDFGNEDITYYFSTDNGNTYNKCINDSTNSVGPINAGSYLIKVEYTLKYKDTDGNDQEKVYTKDGITFEIRPFKINSSNTKYSILGEYEYTGSEIKPNLVLTTTISSSKVFTLTSNDYSITGATNASTNATSTITGKGNYEGTIQISYVINKKHISLVKKKYEIKYDPKSRDAGKWSNFSAQLKNLIEFTDKNGNSFTIANDQYDVGIYDGTFGYGLDESKNNNSLTLILTNIGIENYSNGTNVSKILSNATKKYEYVIGSTYEIQVKITSDNYILDNDSLKNILRYKTALVDEDYYTIEEAMNLSSGTITFPGDASDVGTFVYTAFTNLENTPYGTFNYTLNGRTLLLPFEDSVIEKSVLSTKTTTSYGNIYAALYIPKQVSISVENSAKISICAEIGYNQKVSTTLVQKHGVIYNDGNIIFNESTYLYSYGYIKGTGKIEMKNNSLCMALFSVHDFPGGTAGSQMYTKVLVTNSWTFHTISCELFLYSGCQYQSFFHVVLSDSDCDASPILVGKGDKKDQNCLFIPNDINSNNYLRISSSPAISWKTKNESGYLHYSLINGCNQLIGQRDQIEINGDYYDSTFSMEIKGYKVILGQPIAVKVNFNTSTDISATIGLADIVINENSSLELTKSSYLFLPGSKLEIRKGGKLKIGSGVNLSFVSIAELNALYDYNQATNSFQNKSVDHDDAVLNIAGEIRLETSSSIGGKIIATDENARLYFASGTLSTSYNIYYDIKSPFYENGTATAKGSIDNVDGEFTSSSYVSTANANNDGFTWISEDNVNIYNINFYDDDTLIITKEIQVLSGEIYEIKSTIFNFKKLFYELDTENPWLQSINGLSAIGKDISKLADDENNLNLYANWIEKTYSITYYFGCVIEDGSINSLDESDINFESKLDEFTISNFIDNILNISTKASYNNMFFNGWYIGIDKRINKTFTSITLEQFEQYLTQYPNMKLMLYGEFIESPANITFTTDYSDVATPISGTIKSSKGLQQQITLTDLDELSYQNTNNNNKFEYYFVGWYIKNSDTVYNPNETIKIDIAGDIEFIAKWEKKITISFGEAPSGYTYIDESNIYAIPHSNFRLIKFGNTTEIQSENKNILDRINFKCYKISIDSSTEYQLNENVEDVTEDFTITPIVESERYYCITYEGDTQYITDRPQAYSYNGVDYISSKTTTLSFKVKGKTGGIISKRRTTITITSGTYNGSKSGEYSDTETTLTFENLNLSGKITVTAKYAR